VSDSTNTSTAEIQSRIAETRAQLESTLDSIEDRLNVPKQFGILLRRAKESYEGDPAPWIAGAGGVAAVLGTLLVVAVKRR
jgi:hypothetical protein